MNELLTIIIPTKDRHLLLDRSLLHYVKSNISVRIIIADSSSNASGSSTEMICAKYSGKLDIDYFHVPEDTDPSMKNSIAADMVCTPYILGIGDDDFPLKSSLEKVLSKLEEDSSIAAAFGNRVAIVQISNKEEHQRWIKAYPNYSGISINSNNPLDRIKRLPIPNWQQYGNAIIRTNVFKKAYKIVSKLNHTQYSEFFLFSAILMHGTFIKYDLLFAICHQESKFCPFKDRYLFPHYIGSGGSVLSGISQNDWSKTVSSLCDIVGKEIATIYSEDDKDISLKIRQIYYSKLVHYLEYNNNLSDNLIDSDSVSLRRMNGILRKFSKFNRTLILYDRSGGILEWFRFILYSTREIITGRFFRVLIWSPTVVNISGLLSSIKRTGSLDYESYELLKPSSKYHDEYKSIFDTWTNNPCPQKCPKQLKKDLKK